MRRYLVSLSIALGVLVGPLAYATGDRSDGPPPSLREALLNFLPAAIILVMLYIFLKRQSNSPRVKRSEEYMERAREHRQRMEEMMERLIKAVEANRKE